MKTIYILTLFLYIYKNYLHFNIILEINICANSNTTSGQCPPPPQPHAAAQQHCRLCKDILSSICKAIDINYPSYKGEGYILEGRKLLFVYCPTPFNIHEMIALIRQFLTPLGAICICFIRIEKLPIRLCQRLFSLFLYLQWAKI